MKKFILIAGLLLVAFNGWANAKGFPAYDAANPQTHCKKEWTKRGILNRDMYDFCMGREKGGYSDAAYLYEQYKNMEWIDLLVNYALEAWTKKGVTQYRMAHYEMDKQIEAFLDIQYDFKTNITTEQDWNKCTSKWSVPDFNMIHYCLEQQRE